MDFYERRQFYYDRLADRRFRIYTESIDRYRSTGEVEVYFPAHCVDHLLGKNSNWSDAKARVFVKLCDFEASVNMTGEYNPNLGNRLDCDIMIGHVYGCFGFRWVDEHDAYIPVSCLETDMRDMCYHPLNKIIGIEEIS